MHVNIQNISCRTEAVVGRTLAVYTVCLVYLRCSSHIGQHTISIRRIPDWHWMFLLLLQCRLCTGWKTDDMGQSAWQPVAVQTDTREDSPKRSGAHVAASYCITVLTETSQERDHREAGKENVHFPPFNFSKYCTWLCPRIWNSWKLPSDNLEFYMIWGLFLHLMPGPVSVCQSGSSQFRMERERDKLYVPLSMRNIELTALKIW
jgi:hypothetical protein